MAHHAARACFFALVLPVAAVAAIVSCDSGYGLDQPTPASDASTGEAGDARAQVDGATQCVPTCAPGACGGDGCGGTCACADGGCVEGACYPCNDPWRVSGYSNAHVFDPTRNLVYTLLPTDGGGAVVASLNACTGKLVADRAGAGGPTYAMSAMAPFGDLVYMTGSCDGGADTCLYRYNAALNTVDARGVVHQAPAPTDGAPADSTWSVAVAGSGKVFVSGGYGSPTSARIVPAAPDGTNCGGAAVTAAPNAQAIGADGDDVWQMLDPGTTNSLMLAHYSAATCATAPPCTCQPDATYPITLPIADGGAGSPSTYWVLARGGVVYVSGWQHLAGNGLFGVGFLVAFDSATKKWSDVFQYAPNAGTKLDGLLNASITSDGKLLYVVGTRDAFGATPHGVLLRFDLPLPMSGPFTNNGEITIAGAGIIWHVTARNDVVFVSGEDDAGLGVVGKCLPNLSCAP